MAIETKNLGVFRKIGLVSKYLTEGWSFERIKQKVRIGDLKMTDMDAIFWSRDYQDFLALRSGQLENEPEKIKDAVWLTWGDPFTRLSELLQDGEIYMFAEEHTTFLYDMVHYLLAPLKTICQKYWTEYDPEMSLEELVVKIRENMRRKGINTARNLRIMSPREGYAQYIKDLANENRTRTVNIRAEFQGRHYSGWELCDDFHLAPISGRDTGLNGMLYVESKCHPEIGERNYPYLYYVCDSNVAELSLESEPKAVRGIIKNGELTAVSEWVRINREAIEKRWNHSEDSWSAYESRDFLLTVRNLEEEYIIENVKRKRG